MKKEITFRVELYDLSLVREAFITKTLASVKDARWVERFDSLEEAEEYYEDAKKEYAGTDNLLILGVFENGEYTYGKHKDLSETNG